MSFEVHVYEDDNTTFVVNLSASRQVRDVSAKDLLDGNGDGSVVIDWDHPDVAELVGGRVVRIYDNERCAFSFTIDKKRTVTVPSSGNDSDRTVTVSGGGLRGYLTWGRVLPWLPTASDGVEDQRPITRRRLFNCVAPTNDLSDWVTPYQQSRTTSEPARPRGWPSNDAKWLWGETESDTMTIGRNWFVRDFTIDADETLVFLVTADDQFVDFLQGAELQREEPEFPAQVWYDPWRSPMKLKAGTYRYGVAAKNEGGKGAVMAECWRTSTAGLTTRVFMTGFPLGDGYDAQYGEWLCLPYPELGDPGYGHTVGRIMGQLLGEAQLRGELPALSWDFDDDLDSNGDPWDVLIPEIDFDATGTLADAVDKLAETYVDVRMGYDNGFVLQLFNKDARGTIQPITLTHANGEISSDAVEETFEVGNDVLMVRDRGMYLADSDLSVLAYGRKPSGSLQVGQLDEPAVLEQIAGAYLDGLTEPGSSRIIEVVPMLDLPAEPGDYIGVEEDLLRLSEIAYKLDFDSLRKTPSLITAYDAKRKKSERVVERMIAEAGNSLASSRVIDTGTNIPSGRLDSVKVTSWSWTQPEDLEVEFWDTDLLEPVGWQAFPIEEPMRLWALIVECDWAEPDGAGGITQVTSGQSRFSLMIDGGPAPVPLIATVPETSGTSDPHIYGIQYIFGPALVMPGQTLSVAPIENGAHINGSATIWATAAL